MNQPKYRRPLNPKQLDILIVLYKFRFATIDLFTDYLDITGKYLYVRLQKLEEQNYVGRNYSNQDKIYNRQATYYLMPKGIKELATMTELNQKALPSMSRDNNRSSSFIERSLMTLKLHNKFRELYGNKLEFYTKNEISDYDFFPKSLPDGYLLINEKPCMLDWLPDNTLYQSMRGRISQLIQHYNSGEWNDSDMDYPTILFICVNPYIERQVQRIAKRSLNKAEEQLGIDSEDLAMLTTTLKAFNNAQSNQETIWSDVREPEELMQL